MYKIVRSNLNSDKYSLTWIVDGKPAWMIENADAAELSEYLTNSGFSEQTAENLFDVLDSHNEVGFVVTITE